MIKVFNRQPIIELWNQGVPADQIVERLTLPISIRQVQRIGVKYGSHRARWMGRLERKYEAARDEAISRRTES